ncbi:MAG: arsenate reductase ArsC [Planctomycetota bacterium]|jgi:arsenate reductase
MSPNPPFDSGAPAGLPRVLFLCIGNSCRSPMGEGWLRHLAGDRFHSTSAGIRPIGVHPLAIRVMEEVGVDLSGQDSSFIHHKLQPPPATVIALSKFALKNCPPLPHRTEVLRWFIPDPYEVKGDLEKKLRAFRGARDELRERLGDWLGV